MFKLSRCLCLNSPHIISHRHFTIRGAEGTDFAGGVYHGRILLPPEYPFKPPHIMFLTPSGRFETGTKVCLSFSAYHPELWQPAWGIRLILEALISFLPTPADGAIGALDWTSEERKRKISNVNYTTRNVKRDLLTICYYYSLQAWQRRVYRFAVLVVDPLLPFCRNQKRATTRRKANQDSPKRLKSSKCYKPRMKARTKTRVATKTPRRKRLLEEDEVAPLVQEPAEPSVSPAPAAATTATVNETAPVAEPAPVAEQPAIMKQKRRLRSLPMPPSPNRRQKLMIDGLFSRTDL